MDALVQNGFAHAAYLSSGMAGIIPALQDSQILKGVFYALSRIINLGMSFSDSASLP
jgi:hypothetical protein